MAVLVLGGVLAALVLVTSWVLHVGPFAPDERGPVIATADGEPIYLNDARSRVAGLTTAHGGLADTLGSEWHDQVLGSLVDDVIVREEAERRELSMTDQESAKELLRIQGMFSSLSEYQAWLDGQQIDEPELERRIALQTTTARVYDAITSGVTVDDAEIRSYYDEHPDEFTEGGTVSPFESVRDQIAKQMREQRQSEIYATWLQSRREEVNVVILMSDWWRSIEDEQPS
jgi:hypothetical protein